MAGEDSPERPEATEVVGRPRLLAGKYRIGRLIGEGGMGSVFLADHTGLDAPVAVKLLNEACIADPDSLARFRREAVVMGAVRHDNVVAVMDTGTDEEGVPFIVMEYLEGETLGSVLRRNRTVAGASACRIATQILAGLAAAHGKGVVHRDLKPGNVFMAKQPDGAVRAKLLDFGVSKLADAASLSVTAEGVAVGTPTYMAPEQIRGDLDLDHRVDIYAVGVILYRMLTGKLPFLAGTSEELAGKILDGAPRKPSAMRPDITPTLERAILKAMSVDPDERYATAEEFRLELAASARAQIGVGGFGDVAALVASATESAGHAADPTEVETIAASPAAKRETVEQTRSDEPRQRRLPSIIIAAAIALIVGGGLLYVLLGSKGEPTGPPLSFGITQFLPQHELEPRFEPFLSYLETQLGRPIELRLASDVDELNKWISRGEIEFAALSPFPYVQARRSMPGLQRLASAVTLGGRTGYYGSILVRTDSEIKSLATLGDKPFCFVRRGSTSGWLLPRRALRKAGVDPDRFPSVHYGRDHLGTLKLLAKGACVAAAVYTKLWHDADEHELDPASFRSIANYLMPHDAYVAGPDVDAELAAAIRAALLTIEPGSNLAVEVMSDLDLGGFVAGSDGDFDDIERAVSEEKDLSSASETQ